MKKKYYRDKDTIFHWTVEEEKFSFFLSLSFDENIVKQISNSLFYSLNHWNSFSLLLSYYFIQLKQVEVKYMRNCTECLNAFIQCCLWHRIYKLLCYLTWTIFVISCISMTPFPSTSYILKAHFNFSSGVPLDVTSIANKNSWKRKHNSLIKMRILLRYTLIRLMKKFHFVLKPVNNRMLSTKEIRKWNFVEIFEDTTLRGFLYLDALFLWTKKSPRNDGFTYKFAKFRVRYNHEDLRLV